MKLNGPGTISTIPVDLFVSLKRALRLDAMHNGIDKFLGGKLSPADLGKPQKILEIGYEVFPRFSSDRPR